jgi:hypothetical protein
LVASNVIVTGPMELLREIAQVGAAAARAALPVLGKLIEAADTAADLVLLADGESLRRANLDLPAAWLAAHSDFQNLWRSFRPSPQGALVQVSLQSGLTAEVRVLCADEAAAESARMALESMLKLLPSILGEPAQASLGKPEAQDLDAAVFTEALQALSQAKTGQRDAIAWARLSLTTDAPQLASTGWATWKIWEYLHRDAERAEPRLVVDASGLDLKLPEVEYRQALLTGFIEDMSRLSNVPIVLDLDALAEAGLSQEIKVSVKQTGATIAAVLRAALEPHELEYVIDPEGVLVTTKQRRRGELQVVEYDVADLVKATPAKELADMCRRLVEPASWNTPRAETSITVSADKLQVRQGGAVHDDLLLFLEKLRVARGLTPKQLSGVKLETRFMRVRDRLAKEVTASFTQPTPLARIAAFLGQRAGAKVAVDGVALRRVGFDPSDGVTLTADKEPLIEALGRLTKSLDIGWRIVDDTTLQITSRAGADRGELEFYQVADLLGPGVTAEGLSSRLRDSLASETWAPTGPGVLHYDAASRCMIILHSQAVHLQVEEHLATERAKKTAKPADKSP